MRTYGLLVMLLCAGCEGQPDPLKGHPLKSLVHFEAIHYAAGKEHPRQLIIRGKLDGPGKLDLNPNHLMLGTDGKIQGSTCLGWAPVPVQIKSVETPDPDKKGRKVYDIIPEKGELERKFSLILSESDAGPHHLLIREGEKVVGTYPLVPPAPPRRS